MDQVLDAEYDVAKEDPFRLKDLLSALAHRATGVTGKGLINLGRGDPLDPPSVRAAGTHAFFACFGYLLQSAAGQLSNDISAPSWAASPEIREAWSTAETMFRLAGQAEPIADARWIRDVLSDRATSLSHPLHLGMVVREFQGADYGPPGGDNLVVALVAERLRQELWSVGDPFGELTAEGIILTNGASDAISATFKLLCELGYLRPGDRVGCMSPVYSPYNTLAEVLGLRVISLACDPDNAYEPTRLAIDEFRSKANGIKLFSLVNPSNPTGRAYSEEFLSELAEIARSADSILVEDVVYRKFVTRGRFSSIGTFAPERTLIIDSMSKFHRAPGTRVGCIALSPEANEALTARFRGSLGAYSGNARDFAGALVLAKAPSTRGIFYHTQMVSRPSQWLGLFRLLLGEEDGRAFVGELQQRWDLMYHKLLGETPQERALAKGLWPGFAPYYCLIDLLPMLDDRTASADRFAPWRFLRWLAEEGVVVLPAARFFSAPERHRWVVRISVANQPLDCVEEAADLIRSATAEFGS